jgi:hypothetical protein
MNDYHVVTYVENNVMLKHQMNMVYAVILLKKQFQNVVIQFVLNVVKHRLLLIVKNHHQHD